MQKMVIFIKANTYNTSNLSKLGPRVVAHIILSHPNGCGVPHLGLGVMSHKCLFAGPWGLIVLQYVMSDFAFKEISAAAPQELQ
jgi:hypothetical protein